MNQHSENPQLTADELSQRVEIEQRILTRSAGRIGDGLDLIKIRDGQLYRDYETFDAYVLSRFDVAPGSAYRWISAAEIVQEVLQKFSPKGEIEAPVAWKMLCRHRNETAIRVLQDIPSPEKRWETYKKAVELSKGHEPKPRHLRQAAVFLKYREDSRDPKDVGKATAFTLIVGVRTAVGEIGRKDLARRLDDALRRLGYNESRARPAGLLPRMKAAKS